jgi:hypothetical protein
MWRLIATVTAVNTVEVTGPDGAVWQVRVAWMPRWRALARRFGGWRRARRDPVRPPARRSGGGDGDLSGLANVDTGGHGGGWGDLGDDILIAILVIIGMIVFGLLFWWVLLPLTLLVVDGVVVVALAVVAIPARILFRRPWTVEAVCRDERVELPVVGWRRATDVRDELAARIARGDRTLPLVG